MGCFWCVSDQVCCCGLCFDLWWGFDGIFLRFQIFDVLLLISLLLGLILIWLFNHLRDYFSRLNSGLFYFNRLLLLLIWCWFLFGVFFVLCEVFLLAYTVFLLRVINNFSDSRLSLVNCVYQRHLFNCCFFLDRCLISLFKLNFLVLLRLWVITVWSLLKLTNLYLRFSSCFCIRLSLYLNWLNIIVILTLNLFRTKNRSRCQFRFHLNFFNFNWLLNNRFFLH